MPRARPPFQLQDSLAWAAHRGRAPTVPFCNSEGNLRLRSEAISDRAGPKNAAFVSACSPKLGQQLYEPANAHVSRSAAQVLQLVGVADDVDARDALLVDLEHAHHDVAVLVAEQT